MNVTLSIDDQTVTRARELAQQQGTSLNQMIRDYLQSLTTDDPAQEWPRWSASGTRRRVTRTAGSGAGKRRMTARCFVDSNVLVRKQYYFRPSDRGLLAWDVDRLVELSSQFPRKNVPLTEIRELDEAWSGDDEYQTWRAMIEHVKLMEEADLSFPIILSASGRVMDGMHRVAKAVLQGRPSIEAVQFDEDPAPDHVGREPMELPY